MTMRFHVGDVVRTRATRAPGHTRLPGYLRGVRGTITSVHGLVPVADDRAVGRAAPPEALYTVLFDGRDVWGDAPETPRSVAADLWDRYLEADATP
jgi:nitrile hydratase